MKAMNRGRRRHRISFSRTNVALFGIGELFLFSFSIHIIIRVLRLFSDEKLDRIRDEETEEMKNDEISFAQRNCCKVDDVRFDASKIAQNKERREIWFHKFMLR